MLTRNWRLVRVTLKLVTSCCKLEVYRPVDRHCWTAWTALWKFCSISVTRRNTRMWLMATTERWLRTLNVTRRFSQQWKSQLATGEICITYLPLWCCCWRLSAGVGSLCLWGIVYCGGPSICPLTSFCMTQYLYLVERFQWNVAQIFIMWKVFWGQRSRSSLPSSTCGPSVHRRHTDGQCVVGIETGLLY